MQFVRITKITRTLRFRLTLMAGLILAVLSMALIVILDGQLAEVLDADIDRQLRTELHEFQIVFREGGLTELRKEIAFEESAYGPSQIFIRLYDRNAQVVVSTDLENWEDVAIPDAYEACAEPRIYRSGPSAPVPYRMACGLIGDEFLVLMGLSTTEMDAVLADYRGRTVRAGFGAILCCVVAAWLIARRALRGIELLAESAEAIDATTIGGRIKPTGYGEEIDQLAKVLNEMLQRIQLLVHENRALNDNIAHELRSPLTRIRGAAELAITKETSLATCRTMAADVVENCDALLHLINTMLAISELDSGAVRITPRPVNWSETVSDTCEWFATAAEDKHISLETNIEADVYVMGDVSLLRQALANLLDNAIKFTDGGGVIAVSLARDGELACLRVRNTGAGIAAADLPRLFERFYRSPESMAVPGNGLGLGLVKVVVTAHGGTVNVESIKGSFAEFAISLPYSDLASAT